MRERRESKVVIITSFVLLAILIVYSISNAPLLKIPLEKFANDRDFSALVENIKSVYVSDDLEGKNNLININGLFARLTNRHIYNDVTLLKNGYLGSMDRPYIDMTSNAEKLVGLSRYLKEKGTPFLYVQAGHKVDIENAVIPEGIENFMNDNANHLIELLKNSGVSCLDLRQVLNATPEALTKYYFKTDHHWNYDGAFIGFQHIVAEIDKILTGHKLNLKYANKSMWETHLLEDHFLGSYGKRVGRFYAGLDDINYYTPKFETSMSCLVPKHYQIDKGTFADAVIRSEYLEKTDYYSTNPYCLYIGGDYPLVKHRNIKAPNDLKLLLVKDSYMLPIQAFMSAIFSEIDVIDPRHFTESSLIEYINQHDFDAVMYMLCLDTTNYSEYFDKIGNPEEQYFPQEELVFESESAIQLHKSDSQFNYWAVPVNLEYGKEYVVRFDNVNVVEGKTDGVCLRLYDFTDKNVLNTTIFDIEYCNTTDGYEWYFAIPENTKNDIELLLYSGIAGNTNDISLVYENLSVFEVK